jgi:hypothetical protein
MKAESEAMLQARIAYGDNGQATNKGAYRQGNPALAD